MNDLHTAIRAEVEKLRMDPWWTFYERDIYRDDNTDERAALIQVYRQVNGSLESVLLNVDVYQYPVCPSREEPDTVTYSAHRDVISCALKVVLARIPGGMKFWRDSKKTMGQKAVWTIKTDPPSPLSVEPCEVLGSEVTALAFRGPFLIVDGFTIGVDGTTTPYDQSDRCTDSDPCFGETEPEDINAEHFDYIVALRAAWLSEQAKPKPGE